MGTHGNAAIARSPVNKGVNGYPYAEAVLIDCTLENISPEGWVDIHGETHHLRFLEYNSTDKEGRPVDVSRRHNLSRQLTLPDDAALLDLYRSPAQILEWNPEQ